MSTTRCRPGPVPRDDRRKAERLLSDNLVQLTARAIELAMMGDSTAVKVCLDRCWPVPQVPDPATQPEARP